MRRHISLSVLSAFFLAGSQSGIALAEPTGMHAGQTFPIREAYNRYHRSKHKVTLNAINQARQKMTLSWTDGPGPQASFEGVPAVTFVSEYLSTTNGTPNYTATDTEYFAAKDMAALGTVVAIKGNRGLVKRYSTVKAVPLPQSAHIGESGPYGEILGYNDVAKTQLLDRRVGTWKLEADPQSPDRALFCINEEVTLTATADVRQTANECYHEDRNGNLTAPIEIDGGTTIFH